MGKSMGNPHQPWRFFLLKIWTRMVWDFPASQALPMLLVDVICTIHQNYKSPLYYHEPCRNQDWFRILWEHSKYLAGPKPLKPAQIQLEASKKDHMDFSINGGTPKSSIFNGIVHYKVSIWRYLHLWKPPSTSIFSVLSSLEVVDFRGIGSGSSLPRNWRCGQGLGGKQRVCRLENGPCKVDLPWFTVNLPPKYH